MADFNASSINGGGTELKADILTHYGSLATNFVVHGSNKMWIAFNGNSATAYDRLNVASETDGGTGDYTFNLPIISVLFYYRATNLEFRLSGFLHC